MTANLETLTPEQCRAKLRQGTVGRVSVTQDALPVIVPVNYVLDGNSVVFRTRDDGMLASACRDTVIAFEIDELASDGSSGWSVLVVGNAAILTDSEHLRALSLGLSSAVADERDRFVRLRIGLLSGRQVAPVSALRPVGATDSNTAAEVSR